MSKILLLLMLSCFSAYGRPLVRQVLINGKIHQNPSDAAIHLGPADEDLVIEFEPVEGDSVRYAFSLSEGKWYSTTYPVVHYSGLNGGRYTLRVKATGKGIREDITSISIDVQQAFWQKWWFWPMIAVYILLILGVGFYLFFLYNLRQKLKMHHIRNQIASDLHDEVGSNLNSIAIFVELLRKKAHEGNPDILNLLDKITDNSEETVALMRDTVWAINPANDSVNKLIEKMRSFGAELLSAKGIAFDFDCRLDTTKTAFSMEQRRNLYLVYKESVNNIAKHAEATKASCEVTHVQGIVHVRIKDNGKGFDLAKTFEGNGLKNFNMRSREEDLKVKVDSTPGNGTAIHIELSV